MTVFSFCKKVCNRNGKNCECYLLKRALLKGNWFRIHPMITGAIFCLDPTQVTDKVHRGHNSIHNLTSPRAEVAYLTISLPWRSSNKLTQRMWMLSSTNWSATSC